MSVGASDAPGSMINVGRHQHLPLEFKVHPGLSRSRTSYDNIPFQKHRREPTNRVETVFAADRMEWE